MGYPRQPRVRRASAAVQATLTEANDYNALNCEFAAGPTQLAPTNAQVGSFGTKRSYSRTRTSRLVIFAHRRGRVRTLVSSHAGETSGAASVFSLSESRRRVSRVAGSFFLPTAAIENAARGRSEGCKGQPSGRPAPHCLRECLMVPGDSRALSFPGLLRQTRDGVLSPPSSNAAPSAASATSPPRSAPTSTAGTTAPTHSSGPKPPTKSSRKPTAKQLQTRATRTDSHVPAITWGSTFV